jgi:hypothetical protein
VGPGPWALLLGGCSNCFCIVSVVLFNCFPYAGGCVGAGLGAWGLLLGSCSDCFCLVSVVF